MRFSSKMARAAVASFGFCAAGVAWLAPAGATVGNPTVQQTISVTQEFPHSVSDDGTHVWTGSNTVVAEFSATDGSHVRDITIPVIGGEFISSVFSDGTWVYVAQRNDGGASLLFRIDCSNGQLDSTSISLGSGMGIAGIYADASYVWIAEMNSNSIGKVDKNAWSGTATTITGFDSPRSVTSLNGTVWVADNGLRAMDITTSSITNHTDAAFAGTASAVTSGNGQVWVNGWSSAYQIDPTSGSILNTVANLNNINCLSITGARLWAGQGNSFALSEIDNSNATLSGTADMSVLGYGTNTISIASDGSHAWALAFDSSYASVLLEINPGAEVTTTTSTTTSTSTSTTAGPTTSAASTTSTTAASGGLATTGGDLRGVLVLGAILLTGGAVLAPSRRKRLS